MSTANKKSIRLTESTLKKLIVQEVRRFLKEGVEDLSPETPLGVQDDKKQTKGIANNPQLEKACLKAVKEVEASWKPEIDRTLKAVLKTEGRISAGTKAAEFGTVIFDRYWAMLNACLNTRDRLRGRRRQSFDVEGAPKSVLDYIMTRAEADYSIAEAYKEFIIDNERTPDREEIRDMIQNSKKIKARYVQLGDGDTAWHNFT